MAASLQFLLHDVQRQHCSVGLTDGVGVDAHDAEAHLFVQAAGTGVALDELQLHDGHALTLAGKGLHGLEHRRADAVAPVCLAQGDGDRAAMAHLDLPHKGQMAVAGDVSVHLAEDHAVVGGIHYPLQEADLLLHGHIGLFRGAEDEGRISCSIEEVLHQIGRVLHGIGGAQNRLAAILEREYDRCEDHLRAPPWCKVCAGEANDASPAQSLS